MLTKDEITEALGCPEFRAGVWCDPLNEAMERYQIATPLRIAAFLAQVGHESGRLVFVRELWNPKQCPWQADYEGRTDLGNTQPGDGSRFRGRGLIQITGRANYHQCGIALGLPLEDQPELLEQPEHAAMSAAWFWGARKLNDLADAEDFETITRRINGGLNGYKDRLHLYDAARKALDLGEMQ